MNVTLKCSGGRCLSARRLRGITVCRYGASDVKGTCRRGGSNQSHGAPKSVLGNVTNCDFYNSVPRMCRGRRRQYMFSNQLAIVV